MKACIAVSIVGVIAVPILIYLGLAELRLLETMYNSIFASFGWDVKHAEPWPILTMILQAGAIGITCICFYGRN